MAWQSIVHALSIAVLATAPEPAWEKAAETDGITVYSRARPGVAVREVKATASVSAPPHAVWSVIRDYPNYKHNLPYTKDSQVLRKKDGDKIIYFYSVIEAPFVSKRDFVIKIVDESDWRDGQGYLKATWTTSPDLQVEERKRLVRIKVNDGYWLLEPRDDGKTTWVTYYVFTDPGGAIPNFIVNKANTSAVPDLIRAVRKLAAQKVDKG